MALEVPPPEALPVAAPARAASSLISLALVIASVSLATAGHLTLKAAMNRVGRIGTVQVNEPLKTAGKAAQEPRLWLGLALFGISALFWLIVLSRVPLSVAYPFAGLSYVVIVILDRLLLDEPVPTLRFVGAAVVAVGIALIGLSSRTLSGS
ncbi:MAG: EamA family transporter [Actinomycetota bacterium]